MAGDDFTNWRKASYSGGNGGCIEVAAGHSVIGVRDTKQHGQGPVLSFPATAWHAFTTSLALEPRRPNTSECS